LIIAGPDEGGYATVVDNTIQQLGLKDAVRRIGKVSHEAKVKLLKSADLFVLPSYSEGFTSAILEAMACELPVVATRTCNFPDITGAQAGWECEPTVDSLVEALKMALLATESERRQRGQNGFRLVGTHYTWPAIINHLQQACTTYC
jgi:glycosyltransferase involved in cell wall biosynthesis